MTRHGTAGFFRVWRSHPFWGEIFKPRAPCPAGLPRLELAPDPEGTDLPWFAPGEVAEWSNAPHSKCGIGASLSGVRIPPSPPMISDSAGAEMSADRFFPRSLPN